MKEPSVNPNEQTLTGEAGQQYPALGEVMQELFTSSQKLDLDFINITAATPEHLDIRRYFRECEHKGINPRQPENRQRFNDNALKISGKRYLIGRYAEDRAAMLADTQIARESRTIHLGIDIFSTELEPIIAPCDGYIVRRGKEPGFATYGNYLIFQAAKGCLLFLGHLASQITDHNTVSKGETIGFLGDYIDDENGGWSRHLHLQVLRTLPKENTTPDGYSTTQMLPLNIKKYPSPFDLFPSWNGGQC